MSWTAAAPLASGQTSTDVEWGWHVTNGADDDKIDLAFTVVLAGLAIADYIRDSLVAHGIAEIRFSQLFVFARLAQGPATIGDIANQMGFSHQAASMLVNELEGAGLVRRYRNPDDGRSRLVELTPDGMKTLRIGMAAKDDLLGQLRNLISDEDFTKAYNVTTALLGLAGGIDTVRIRDLGFPRPD